MQKKQIPTPTWFTGKVAKVNPERRTGVIKQFDGEDVLFSLDDFIEQVEEISPATKVFYKLDKTEIGLKASTIMLSRE